MTRRPQKTLTRAATLTAAAGLALALAACGGDDSGSDNTTGNGTSDATSATADLNDIMDKAAEAGYTCSELKDTEDPTTGLTGAVSCIPSADRVGTDPMFTLFSTDTVSSGTDAAQKAVDRSSAPGGTGANLDPAVVKNMFATLDADGVAGFCLDENGNCEKVVAPFGLTVGKLDGSLSSEDASQKAQDEAQQRYEDEQRASESAAAQATEEAQRYVGWDDIDAAVEQMDAWGFHCMEPDNEPGMWGTTCGNNDDALFFGDRGDFVDYIKGQGATEDQLDRMVRVSDGDWTLMCRPDARETCDTVADRTGKDVEEGM